MATVDPCYAAYLKCLGTNPSPIRQIQCTFAYAACVHQGLAEMVQEHIAGAGVPAKAPKKATKKGVKKKSKSKGK